MSPKLTLFCLPLLLSATLARAAEPEPPRVEAAPPDQRLATIEGLSDSSVCAKWLTNIAIEAGDGSYEKEAKTLLRVRELLPKLYTPEQIESFSWVRLLDRFGVPSARKISPALTMVPFSDSNMGKSIWVNKTVALLSGRKHGEIQDVVPVGAESGSTKRSIVVMSDAAASGRGNMGLAIRDDVMARYENPKTVDTDSALRETGETVVRVAATLPDDMELILVDAPDMSSGPVGQPTPRYQEAVDAAILPADVMVFFINRSNYNRQSFKQAIRNVFNTNGARSSIIIWNGKADKNQHETLGFIRQFAEEIYDAPRSATGLPEGVLGAYWTPESEAVEDNQAYPEYIPFPNFPDYADLLQSIRDHGDDIKKFSIRHALKRIQTDMRRMLTDEARRIYAAEIWGRTLDSAIVTMAQSLQERVPYDEIRSTVRERFFELHSGGMTRIVHRVVDKFMNLVSDAVTAAKQSRADAERDKHNTDENITNKMIMFVRSFRDGLVNVSRNAPAQDITNARLAGSSVQLMSAKYRRNYLADDLAPEGYPTLDDQVGVELPRLSDLPAEARQMIEEKLLRKDARLLASQIQHKLKSYINLDTAKIRSNDQEVMNALRIKGKTIGTQGFIDYTTALGLLAGVQQLFSSADLHLIWAVGCFVGSNFWYKALDFNRNENIRQALAEHFNRRQFEVARDFLTLEFLDVRNSLKISNHEHVEALSAMQDALALSDDEIPKFSATIEAAPDVGEVVVAPAGQRMFKADYPFRPTDFKRNYRGWGKKTP